MTLDAGYKAKQDGIKQNKTKQDETGLKILTPKQMLQRLPIALAQVKAGNNSESLLNEIRNEMKVYNNIIKSIQISKWILYLWT